ncbi:phage tail tape measure protein [Paenalcaligenes niemegkensis]|uniref:phage tail tape measure protein n=1 Tax=Paenalcaligenes niemegkensis TaxID=2895469 RepID=UPI001EE811E6|nr:phage tail tape measure protein [Paenalcaligenes niemegkensis]MCQ9615943.1 phage tail tape measure protein [Paenalcaligenes niemegkensis]
MATAGSIIVDLLMRTGSFETDSKRAEQRMKQMERQIDKSVKRVALLGTVVAGAFTIALKNASSYMSEIGYAAERTSVSAQAFSELAYAADQANLSQGELERVLRRSTEAINHAVNGTGKQAEALRVLGISAHDAEGNLKTADTMLRDLTDKFSKLEPGARKTGLVLDLFGQQLGQKVIPLLNGGADGLDEMALRARELGIAIDDEAAQAAMDFESNLADLKRTSQGLAVSLATDLIPALNQTVMSLQAARDSSLWGWLFSSGKDQEDPEAAIAKIDKTLAKVRATRETHLQWQEDNKWVSWAVSGDIKDLDLQIANLEARREYLERLKQQTSGGTVPSLAPVLTTPDSSGGNPKRTKNQLDEGQRLIDQMNERIALLGQETEYEKLLARINIESVTFKTDAQKQEALAQAQTLDFWDEQAKAFEESKNLAEEFSTLMAGLFPERAKADQFIVQVDMLNQALEAGWINADMFAESVIKLEDQFSETAGSMSEFAVQAARDIQTHLGDGLYDIVTGNFKGIGDRFADMLLRMATDAAAANLAGALFGDYGSTGKIGGGLLGGIVGGIGGLFGGTSASSIGIGSVSSGLDLGSTIGDSTNFLSLSGGGYTGDIPVDQFAGFVHGQEGVLSAPEMRTIGGEAGFNSLRRLIRGGGNAAGGMGGRPSLPPLPAMGQQSQRPSIVINSTVNAAPGTNMAELGALLDQRNEELRYQIYEDLRRGRVEI